MYVVGVYGDRSTQGGIERVFYVGSVVNLFCTANNIASIDTDIFNNVSTCSVANTHVVALVLVKCQ